MRSKSTVSEGRSLVETQRYGLQRRFRRFARRTNPTCNGFPATITVSSHGRSAKTSGFHGNALTEQATMDDGAPLLLVVLHGTGRRGRLGLSLQLDRCCNIRKNQGVMLSRDTTGDRSTPHKKMWNPKRLRRKCHEVTELELAYGASMSNFHVDFGKDLRALCGTTAALLARGLMRPS
jgi:hypothetical protein